MTLNLSNDNQSYMREITVYEFKELNKGAQLKAVRENRQSIINECFTYLKEIYTEYLYDLVEVVMPNLTLEINLTEDDFTVALRGNLREYAIRREDAKTYLMQASEKAHARQIWFASEITKAANDYTEDTYTYLFIYIQDFLNDIALKAMAWLFKMMIDDEYAVKYILDDAESDWSDPNIFFDGCHFLYDGTKVQTEF